MNYHIYARRHLIMTISQDTRQSLFDNNHDDHDRSESIMVYDGSK